jgi:fatty acid elongase 3
MLMFDTGIESSIRSLTQWFRVDWSTVKWQDMWTIEEFDWEVGKTPFSHVQIPILIAIVYLITVYSLQSLMRDKKPYSLKWISLVHNAFLSALSLVMFLGACYGAILKYKNQGFWGGLVCEQMKDPIKGPLFYWSYIFYLSKFYELLDTYLLVLKKKPLLFLHVFHHTVMPFVCWAGLEGKWAMALWTSTFWNSFVHVIMYFYYFVSTFGYNPWWKRYLTQLQIYQFISGVVYTWVFFYYYFDGMKYLSDGTNVSLSFKQGCAGDLGAIVFMFSVNNSFLFLFTKWYLDNYAASKPRTTKAPQQRMTPGPNDNNNEEKKKTQ